MTAQFHRVRIIQYPFPKVGVFWPSDNLFDEVPDEANETSMEMEIVGYDIPKTRFNSHVLSI